MFRDNPKKDKALTLPNSQQVETEVDQLNKQFESAIRFFKKTKTDQTKKTLHDLPLFLLLGLPGSGKTSLMMNSGLKFILAKRLQQQKPQMKLSGYVDWLATKEALFLDSAGALFQSRDETSRSRKLWLQTLSLLKSHRKNYINGIIITVNISNLLLQKSKQRKRELLLIKQALRDCGQHLTTSMPIYLIFTHMDCLPGFHAFFSGLDIPQKEQYWGFNFLPKQMNSTNAVSDLFDKEFDRLQKRLHNHLLSQLYKNRDLETQGLIKDFPLQFESCKKSLLNFIDKLSPSLSNKKTVCLRGIFFTSAGGAQKTVDRLLPHFDRNFNFDLPAVIYSQQQEQAYFIKNIFTQVVFRDNEAYSQQYSKISSTKRITSIAAIVGAVAVIALTSVYWTGQFSNKVVEMSSIEDALTRYQLMTKSIDFTQVDQAMQALDALLKVTSDLQKVSQPFLSRIGINPDRKLVEVAQQTYSNAVASMFNQQLQQIIANQTQENQQADPGLLYGALATYLTLSEPGHFDTKAISEWVHFYWKLYLKVDDNVLKQLDEHLKHYLTKSTTPLLVNSQLVQKARSVLYQVPEDQLVLAVVEYEHLNQQSYLQLPTNNNKPIFSSNQYYFTFPSIYSRNQFSETYEKAIPQAAGALRFGNWVLGARQVLKSEDNFNKIVQSTRELYTEKYITLWQQALDNLPLRSVTDSQELIQLLDALARPNSPLNQLLATIHYNTNVDYMQLQTPISIAFQRFNRFFESYQQGGFIAVGAHLNRLLDYFVEINSAKDKNAAAFEAAKQRMLLTDIKDVFDDLHIQAKNAPNPLKQWVESITNDAWKILLTQAKHYVDQRWREDIIPFYQYQLRGNYPFDGKAMTEVSLQSFNQFFAPSGIFDLFFVNTILPFVDESTGAWHWRTRDNGSLGFSDNALLQIQRAYQIRQAFFVNDAKSASIHFNLQPSHLSLGVKNFYVDMDDQHLSYSSKQRDVKKLNWPGDAPVHSVTLMVEDDEGHMHKATEVGLWAWFKFFSKASQYESSQQSVEATFHLGPYIAKCDFGSMSVVNPLNPLLLQQLELPEKLA